MQAATTGVTMSEMLRTSAELAANPELRRQFEEDRRSQLNPGESFYVDDVGIGHFHTVSRNPDIFSVGEKTSQSFFLKGYSLRSENKKE